jgi:prepilin-type N-terminal cleavage/methylation domain-containing protein
MKSGNILSFMFRKNIKNREKGFTLLEILLVVAAIGILAGIVIIAINPARQLAQTKNAQRKVDVNTIINAVYQYALDNNGDLPAEIQTDSGGDCPANDGANESAICGDDSCSASYIELDELVPTYVVAIPTDPDYDSGDDGLYDIVQDSGGRVTVCAPEAELGETISVTR